MPPGTRNALVPPSPNYLRDAGQFVGGVGRGLSNQFVTGPLELVQQSYYDPYALGQGVVQGVAQFAQDPVGAVGNSLRSMWTRAKSSPAGLGEVVGENIDPRNWLKPRKAMRQELDVYHGTPHTFEPEEGAPLGKFRSSKIGTGEGAQAYGHGLYFAQDRDIGSGYRSNLSYRDMVKKFRNAMPDDADVSDALDWANSGSAPPEMARVIKALHSDDWLGFDYPSQALNALFKEPDSFDISPELKIAADKMRGNLYKVDLPDVKIEQMLDWDKPFLDQSQAVKDLAKSKLPPGVYQSLLTQRTGDLVEALAAYGGGKAKASELLRQAGIPGIKYLDAGSRKGERGTRNFVVFPGEEQNLTILSRD